MGHSWVKERFGIKPVPQDDGTERYIGTVPDKPFIPAFVQDNDYVDQEGYLASLDKLDPVTREQMKKGDWGVSEDARFKKKWFRYYSQRGANYVLGTGGHGPVVERLQRIFTVVDPAASTREGPGDDKRYRHAHSWTVIGTFGLTYDYHLLILDIQRFREEAPTILDKLREVYRLWRPEKIIMEGSGLGKAVYQLVQKYGLPVQPIFPHADKIARATDAMTRAEQGRIWLPEHPGPAWLERLENELFTWTGHPYEVNDQIDVLAYAAQDISWEAAAIERGTLEDNFGLPMAELPVVILCGIHFGAIQHFLPGDL